MHKGSSAPRAPQPEWPHAPIPQGRKAAQKARKRAWRQRRRPTTRWCDPARNCPEWCSSYLILRLGWLARLWLALDFSEYSRALRPGRADNIPGHAVERELREPREDHRFLRFAVEEGFGKQPHRARREQRAQ